MMQHYLFALVLVCVALDVAISQRSNPYTPFGRSPLNWPSASAIQSASADGQDQLWVISLNSTRYVYSAYSQSGLTGLRDLYRAAPTSANQPIARLVRAVNPASANPVLYIEDIANSWIAIVDSFDGRWYRTLQISDFRTYQVSSNGGRLAVARGHSQGSHFIDYIEMWNTANTGSILYRVNLHGLQATTGYSITQDLRFLYVPIGMNNSVNQYRLSNGQYSGSHAVQIPDFSVHAVAVVDEGTIAMMDCTRAKVHFTGQISSTYSLNPFNMSMCSESISTLGPSRFAVLDGERYTYFAPGLPSSSSSSAASPPSQSSSSSAISSSVFSSPTADRSSSSASSSAQQSTSVTADGSTNNQSSSATTSATTSSSSQSTSCSTCTTLSSSAGLASSTSNSYASTAVDMLVDESQSADTSSSSETQTGVIVGLAVAVGVVLVVCTIITMRYLSLASKLEQVEPSQAEPKFAGHIVIDYIDPFTTTATPRSVSDISHISSTRAVEISESS